MQFQFGSRNSHCRVKKNGESIARCARNPNQNPHETPTKTPRRSIRGSAKRRGGRNGASSGDSTHKPFILGGRRRRRGRRPREGRGPREGSKAASESGGAHRRRKQPRRPAPAPAPETTPVEAAGRALRAPPRRLQATSGSERIWGILAAPLLRRIQIA